MGWPATSLERVLKGIVQRTATLPQNRSFEGVIFRRRLHHCKWHSSSRAAAL